MSIVLPSAYNLARAGEERRKAESCWCVRTRRLHLEMAALFEARAEQDGAAFRCGSPATRHPTSQPSPHP